MKNLAGHPQATELIVEELNSCGINLVNEPKPLGEPLSLVSGWLGNYSFMRAWTYWIVEGKVPLKVAQQLYEDPLGARDVRVNGHCDRLAPVESQLKFYNSLGYPVYLPSDRDLMEKIRKEDPQPSHAKRIMVDKFLNHSEFSENRMEIPNVESFVEVYHIDSLAGLKLFITKLNEHGLVPDLAPVMDAKNLCNRKACRQSGAICWNPMMNAYYCVRCARNINQATEEMSENLTHPIKK